MPDLVFNEMRFLQRPTEHQDAPNAGLDQQKRSKHDRKRPKDGEISAYFEAKKQAHEQLEHRTNRHDKASAEDRQPIDEPARRRRLTPPVDRPSRPFLGFGSKGGQPEGKDMPSEHTSYLSWSQTPPQEPVKAQRRSEIEVHNDEEQFPKGKSKDALPQRYPTSRLDGLQQSSEIADGGQERAFARGEGGETRGQRGAAQVEVHQPQRIRHSVEDRRSTTMTTAQSLPRGNVEPQPDVRRQTIDQFPDDYRTSDILEVHDHIAVSKSGVRNLKSPSTQPRDGHENQDPASSLSIDRLLDNVRYVTGTKPNESQHRPYEYNRSLRDRSAARHASTPHKEQVILAVRGELYYALRENSGPSPALRRQGDDLSGTRTTFVPDVRQYEQHALHPDSVRRHPPAEYVHIPQIRQPQLPEDDEMLDDGQEIGPGSWLHQPVYASMQQAEELVHGPMSNATLGIFEAQSEHLASVATSLWQRQERTHSLALNGRSLSIGRLVSSESGTGPGSGGAADEMSGFWKPHRLY